MPAAADVVAAGGVASTVGSNTNYAFNASVPAQRKGFFSLLQEVRLMLSLLIVMQAPHLLQALGFVWLLFASR